MHMNKSFALDCLVLPERFLGIIFKMQFSLRQANSMREFKEMQLGTFTQETPALLTHSGHSPQMRGNGGGHFAGGVPRSQPRDGGLAPPATSAVTPQARVWSPGPGQMSRGVPEGAAWAGQADMAAAGPALLLHFRL